jgi:hypothetical protein
MIRSKGLNGDSRNGIEQADIWDHDVSKEKKKTTQRQQIRWSTTHRTTPNSGDADG